jgi:hypothetical protein
METGPDYLSFIIWNCCCPAVALLGIASVLGFVGLNMYAVKNGIKEIRIPFGIGFGVSVSSKSDDNRLPPSGTDK